MQVIEMDDMILHILNGFNDVADQTGIRRDLDPEGIFDSSHGAECVYSRSNTADALRKCQRIAWIPPLKDNLDATEHGAAAPGFCHHAAIHFHFNAQVAFNAGDRINGNLGHVVSP